MVSFLQQKKSMALTVRAVRSLTTSLQVGAMGFLGRSSHSCPGVR